MVAQGTGQGWRMEVCCFKVLKLYGSQFTIICEQTIKLRMYIVNFKGATKENK